MVKKEKKNINEIEERNVDKIVEKEIEKPEEEKSEDELSKWNPRTRLGREVKEGKIKDIDSVFKSGLKILEYQIVDKLIPNLESDLILIGQSKGKFGGGKRRIWRQTQKKTAEGNVPSFACMAVVGNRDGYVGVGYGKAKETLPAKEKAIRQAKLNLVKVKRGCGSYDCICDEPHSIPIRTSGKVGKVSIKLIPAPKGTGLVVDDECKKLLRLAGIKDIYSKSYGQTRSKFNMIKACMEALKKLDKFTYEESK